MMHKSTFYALTQEGVVILKASKRACESARKKGNRADPDSAFTIWMSPGANVGDLLPTPKNIIVTKAKLTIS